MRTSLATALTLALAAGMIGCGGGTGGIRVGTMPEGATFHGVWMSPQYGEMHLCQTGGQVVGQYKKDERTGLVQGEVEGDVLFFKWSEEREMVVGRPTLQEGLGYLRLERGEDQHLYFTGEWGLNEDRTGGGPWNGVLLDRRRPDECYDSVRSSPGATSNDGWDEEEQEGSEDETADGF